MTLRVLAHHPDGVGADLAISPSGRWWVSATTNSAQVWRDGSLHTTARISGYVAGPPAFSTDESSVSVGSCSIDLADGAAQTRWVHPDWLTAELDDDVTAESFGTPFVADVPGADRAVVLATYQPPRGRGATARYSGPRERLLIVAPQAQRLVRVLAGDADGFSSAIAVSATTVVGAAYTALHTWRSTDGEPVAAWAAPHSVEAVAIGALDRIALLDRSGVAHLTNVAGELDMEWQAHDSAGAALAWGVGNDWLATGSKDGTVRIWRLDTARPTLAGEHVGTSVGGLASSPDGRILLASGDVVNRGLTVLSVDA